MKKQFLIICAALLSALALAACQTSNKESEEAGGTTAVTTAAPPAELTTTPGLTEVLPTEVTGEVELTAPSVYARGTEKIQITLKNKSSEQITTGYRFKLERKQERGWEEVDLTDFTHSENPVVFAAVGIPVDPGQAFVFEEDCLNYAEPGEIYRFTYGYFPSVKSADNASSASGEPVEEIPLQCVVTIE